MTEPVVVFNKRANELEFTLSGVNVSIANAIRRIITSEIPCVVFETYPYEKNNCVIHKNTTKLNNEIIKQRLSCVPIHITDLSMPIENYKLVVKKKNESDTIQYVTTEDFKIYDIKNEKFISDKDSQKIFPPDPITKRYIDIVKLKPQLTSELLGEQLDLECTFSISCAKQNGMFNVTSTCSYGNTVDPAKGTAELSKQLKLLKSNGLNKEELILAEKNWNILDSQRHFIENSFDFIIESVGVFDNVDIVKASCSVIIKHLEQLREAFASGTVEIKDSMTTMENCFDIKLQNHDYTIGKILEFLLYDYYFVTKKTLHFCGFRKNHPHDTYSIIRLAYNEVTETTSVITHFIYVIDFAIELYNKLMHQF